MKNKSKMKYYYALIGFLFLVIDTRIKAFAYPAYIPFDTPAPKTVDMIINHVVTDHMNIDIFSDIIGYILVLLSAFGFKKEDWSTHSIDPEIRGRRQTALVGIKKLIPWTIVALICCLATKLFPFFLNGSARYCTGYLIFYVYTFLKAITMIYTIIICTGFLENIKDHMFINTSTIFLLIGIGCYVVSAFVFFYDLGKTYYIYLGFAILFALLGVIRIAVNVFQSPENQ